MTDRERFLATACFGAPDRTYILRPWAWDSTVTRWRSEGLSEDCDLLSEFGTDREEDAPVWTQGKYGPHINPPLERVVLEESSEYRIIRDEEGNTVKLLIPDQYASMPEWIEYPMKNRSDWERLIKPRLDASIPGRLPTGEDWTRYVEKAKNRDNALGVWCGSYYGWPRSFMGVERLSVTFYDDPGLVHEMCEHISEFIIQLMTPVFELIDFDFAFIWEDMAGKAGPLCSPDMYREFMFKPLKKVTDFLHSRGVDIIIVDSDGNNEVLIPIWLEAGVTGLRPFEIAAGSDPVATRRLYGRNLIIQGGIDKRPLARIRDDIDREVLSKVPWLCIQGGYFPQVDHLVPPDVSLENYRYYSNLLGKVVRDPERYLDEARRRGFWED